jgi:hypothetical protein
MLFAGQTEYTDYIMRRRRYVHQSHKETFSRWAKCHLYTFYLITIVVVPLLLLTNAIVLGSEWYGYMYSSESPCENAIRSLIGYAVLYGVIALWIIGYFIINTRSCQTRLHRSGTCGDYFSDVYEAVGVLLIITMFAFNLYASYRATERSFLQSCEDVSASVYSVLVADVVLTHITFDMIVIALVPIAIRKYQWL